MLADCPVNDKSYSALHGWRCVSEWLWSKGQQQQCSTQEWALKGCHVKKTCCPGLCLWRAECLVSNFCHVALWLGKKNAQILERVYHLSLDIVHLVYQLHMQGMHCTITNTSIITDAWKLFLFYLHILQALLKPMQKWNTRLQSDHA